jgi:hypothetical protein
MGLEGRASIDGTAMYNDPYADGGDESQQIRANRRFRSVGGVFTTRRRASRVSGGEGAFNPRISEDDRRNPTALSGAEVNKLTRQSTHGFQFGSPRF